MNFWNDQETAKKISQKIAELKEEIETIEVIKKELYDIQELNGLSEEQDL